jgi:hypothetical protein
VPEPDGRGVRDRTGAPPVRPRPTPRCSQVGRSGATLRRNLDDLPRSGRPPRIAIATRCEVVKLACSRPSDKRTPFESVWTQQAIADALFAECGERISRSSVQRVLSAKGLRPHRVRQWLHSADPNFREKVARVCELYTRPPPRSIVLCVDEKPMPIPDEGGAARRRASRVRVPSRRDMPAARRLRGRHRPRARKDREAPRRQGARRVPRRGRPQVSAAHDLHRLGQPQSSSRRSRCAVDTAITMRRSA